MEVIVTILSKLVPDLFMGLRTYLYRGYNPFTKYHGHPSRDYDWRIITVSKCMENNNGYRPYIHTAYYP